MAEKVSESFRLHLTEREMLDLSRMASAEDRGLSDFVRCVIVRQYLYGQVRRVTGESNRTNSAETNARDSGFGAL